MRIVPLEVASRVAEPLKKPRQGPPSGRPPEAAPEAAREAAPEAAPEALPAAGERKRALRRELLAARLDAARLAVGSAGDAARLAAAAVAFFTGRGWPASVAVYLSIGSEPGTAPLIEAVAERGAKVIVPVLMPDGDLDWALYRPGSKLTAGSHGTVQPATAALGVKAICDVDVIFVPALAVDRAGHRLGRGGGSYDRVLARLRAAESTGLVLAVVHDDELVDELPSEPHDQPVDGVLTPHGLALFDRHTPS